MITEDILSKWDGVIWVDNEEDFRNGNYYDSLSATEAYMRVRKARERGLSITLNPVADVLFVDFGRAF